jgi:hypothetical protein
MLFGSTFPYAINTRKRSLWKVVLIATSTPNIEKTPAHEVIIAHLNSSASNCPLIWLNTRNVANVKTAPNIMAKTNSV